MRPLKNGSVRTGLSRVRHTLSRANVTPGRVAAGVMAAAVALGGMYVLRRRNEH